MFTRVATALLEPRPPLPPVAATRAGAEFRALLEQAPQPQRLGLRLAVIVLAVLVRGRGGPRRLRLVETHAPLALDGIRAAIRVCYYADPAVLELLGYDPGARVERGRELRKREARP